MSALASLEAALAALAGLAPVAATRLPPRAAVGFALAEDARAPADIPAAATALAPGYAVAALDLVGASPHSPVLLARPPARVFAGEPLPAGCDAVLPPGAHAGREATGAVYPGEGARLAGHDLAAGAVLARAGATVTAELALAAEAAGLAALACRLPRVHVAAAETGFGGWAAARLASFGARGEPAGEADLTILWDGAAAPALGLAPGAASRLSVSNGRAALTLAPHTDGAVGGVLALALPVLARLSGRTLRNEARPLAAKITSTVGLSEIALLAERGGDWRPLAVGAAPLAALIEAVAFAILPPACEGLAAGAPLAAIRLDAPFAPVPE
ncbi:MAG: hypothetical protein IPL88_03945 [Rhizobiales bacterium]|nr:hypothetical protein [Hyphomicrobiales bacterium]